jgi:hypothetical protein
MQNSQQKKVVVLLISSLFLVAFLAACNTPAENAATNDANVVNPSGTKTVNGENGAVTGTSDAKLQITGSTQVDGGTSGTSTAKLEISGSQATAPAASDEVKKLLANQDMLNTLVKAGDVAKCKTLEMAQYQVSCEANILANKAKSKTDKAVCKAASTPEAQVQCESVVSTK